LTLVKIAQKDFEAAELLFEKKPYPQAIYMLQQSPQKASKAALLKSGLVMSEDELKKEIRHDDAKKTL
jgi:HEPN domain-containing protein